MLRWLVVASLLCGACKVVHTTADPDAMHGGLATIAFSDVETTVLENAGIARFDLRMSEPQDQPITVTYDVIDGTAFHGVDYSAQGSSITFSPGQTTITGGVNLVPDGLDEPDESFRVSLVSAQGAIITNPSDFWVTIQSNVVPRVSFESGSSMAGEGTAINVPVVMYPGSTQYVTVEYVRGGTAGFSEYNVSPAVVTFAPGSTRELITITKINDSVDEADETITLSLVTPTNANIGPPYVHTHLNLDDDGGASVRFEQSVSSHAEDNSGTKVVTMNVVLSQPVMSAVNVPFFLTAPTTASGNDYAVLTQSPLTFAPGATTATIQVAITGDTTFEGTEDVTLQLGTPSNAILGFPTTSSLRITNDDCVGDGTFAICPDAPATATLVLPPTLDTSTSSLCSATSGLRWEQSGHPYACVVVAQSIQIDNTVVTGTRALVLVAVDQITIFGSLDISGRPGFISGPGSGAYCQLAVDPGPQAGGAGGSFMTKGGDGGSHHNPTGGAGIAPAADAAPPTILRAGCYGSSGGSNPSGTYGSGGGALYLATAGTISITGGARVTASGKSAASGAETSSGGSGGGSGGMIVLHASTMIVGNGYITANGGAGAEGGTSSTFGIGGTSPDPLAPFVPAAGGTGTSGGDGGAGFAQGFAATSGANANASNGAGGGGGGAGYIKTNQPLTNAFVSPAPL